MPQWLVPQSLGDVCVQKDNRGELEKSQAYQIEVLQLGGKSSGERPSFLLTGRAHPMVLMLFPGEIHQSHKLHCSS